MKIRCFDRSPFIITDMLQLYLTLQMLLTIPILTYLSRTQIQHFLAGQGTIPHIQVTQRATNQLLLVFCFI